MNSDIAKQVILSWPRRYRDEIAVFVSSYEDSEARLHIRRLFVPKREDGSAGPLTPTRMGAALSRSEFEDLIASVGAIRAAFDDAPPSPVKTKRGRREVVDLDCC